MTSGELLDRCVRQLDIARQDLAKASASGIRDEDAEEAVRIASVCLRDARMKTGMAICSGNLYCADFPLKTCTAGKHATCSKHTSTCFLCDPLARLEFLPES